MKKKDLIIKCQELNITNYNNKSKNELISLINNRTRLSNDIIYIKPIIKWVGGKTQIIDKILLNFPKEINNYHELFLGGGSVLLALLQNISLNNIKIHGNINAYDINETLINMYINIRDNPSQILLLIKEIINIYNNLDGSEKCKAFLSRTKPFGFSCSIVNRNPLTLDEAITSKESYYYWIRKNFNSLKQKYKNKYIGSAYFIFLNKTCFRGVYREGPNGFNIPFGHYTNPSKKKYIKLY